MRILSLIIILEGILFSSNLLGQNYAAALISKELLKDANAVVREESLSYTVSDTGEYNFNQHIVITVLNKNGDGFAVFKDFYDHYDKITDLKGKVYDAQGKVIRKIKMSDFTDQSAISDFSLYEDNRVKFLVPLVTAYPYTIEYESSEVISGAITYPSWIPQHSTDLAVEHSVYKITLPKNFNVQFKKINYNNEAQYAETSKDKSYTFEIHNLGAKEHEILSPGISDIVPMVYAIPEYFKLDDFSGSNSSWKELGAFQQRLNKQDNTLSAKTKTELADIQAKALNRTDLIRKVYQYMQSKTRYVSIQRGIGGIRPFDASVVDKYGYGDCKALSNYMKTLLHEVGIESCYTLVHASDNANDVICDEVFDQFNHVIVCVPDKKDTIWLECTNQLMPFGFLGDFTDNRHVLLITDQGGQLVKTQAYTKDQNTLFQNADIKLSADGNADCKIAAKYSGLQYDDNFGLINSAPDKQKEKLYNSISIPNFTINNFSIHEEKEQLPWFSLHVNLLADKYATTMGNRLLLPLNILNKKNAISNPDKERKTRLRLRYAYIDCDSITYHLPAGYSLEFMPAPVEIKSEFGTYSTKTILSDDKKSITYIRMLNRNDGYYAPEKFKDYVSFVNQISKQDNIKVSLIKVP